MTLFGIVVFACPSHGKPWQCAPTKSKRQLLYFLLFSYRREEEAGLIHPELTHLLVSELSLQQQQLGALD